MVARATGHLHSLIRNLARDEIKHLAIMSAADRYLFGPRRWRRFLALVKKGLGNYTGQRRSRSGGEALGSNPITALEGIAAHLLTEHFLWKWIDTLPLRTLATVFETPSSLQELAAFAPSPERQAEIELELEKGKQKRVQLERWEPEQRRNALAQRKFERDFEDEIRETIRAELADFSGAETPGSAGSRSMRRRIKRGQFRGGGRIQRALQDQLRDYQVQNNHYILSRQVRNPR